VKVDGCGDAKYKQVQLNMIASDANSNGLRAPSTVNSPAWLEGKEARATRLAWMSLTAAARCGHSTVS